MTGTMLTRFDHKSARVKGLAFHHKRPWLLASLHTGAIQLIDYTMEVVIDKFEEHEGPVRGIDFHQSQPLFVSGGDDYKIKVWNYQLRRCLFTLTGHLDYIRTVQFHHEYPWIVSASDDQTIRIWNWQSRQCIAIITGHNHYVMCAQFHPKDDILVSASLDQTVRVWDFSGLRKKTVSIAGGMPAVPRFGNESNGPNPDLFGTTDVVVKYVLEGHTRGVNWAVFHKKMPLIVSGADDREVKLWRMSDSKAWEIDTMRGHINNVSCVVFHPKKEYLISNSEDKSIRIWDISRQVSPQTFRRDTDRYWILAVHPVKNLIAAGHDNGLLVFKLDRERPPYDSQKQLFYYKDRFVRACNLKTGQDVQLFAASTGRGGMGLLGPRHLHYNYFNPSEHNFLLVSNADGGSFELYSVPKGKSGVDPQPIRGLGLSAVFISRTRFAVLDQSKQLLIKSFQNETKKRIELPYSSVSCIFSAGIDRLLLLTQDRIILYDLRAKKEIGSLASQSRNPVKYVIWSRDRKYVALLSKFSVCIANSRLNELCTITENSRVKSGCWDASGIFFYSTSSHLKYCLVSGDHGIIRTLEDVVYITNVDNGTVNYLNRDVEAGQLSIDSTEAMFKRALITRDLDEVRRIVKSDLLIGQSIISFLQKKGYPDVALHFVQDLKTKFSLALQCGNLTIARECAVELNDKECWEQLGEEALKQGDNTIVELSYQKTRNFEKLAFLYLIVGDFEKLGRMLEIARARNDIMGRFHTSLFLGNAEERVRVLQEAEQPSLAFLTASIHGLSNLATELEGELGANLPKLPENISPKLFTPPQPIMRIQDWPKLEVKKGYFDDPTALLIQDEHEPVPENIDEDGHVVSKSASVPSTEVDLGWDDSDPSLLGVTASLTQQITADIDNFSDTKLASGWGDDFGLDLPAPEESPFAKESMADGHVSSVNDSSYFVMPTLGNPSDRRWLDNASSAVDAICAGAFEVAMQKLNRSLGIVNFGPLKAHFLRIYSSTRVAIPSLPSSCNLKINLVRSETAIRDLPLVCYTLSNSVEMLKKAYRLFTEGTDLPKTLSQFQDILYILPFIVIDDDGHLKELKELLCICREYVTAIRVELARREEKDPIKQCELAAVFTECKLQPLHMFLGLRVAIKSAYTIKNFKTAGTFCRKFLEMSNTHRLPKNLESSVSQVTNVLKACDAQDRDAVQLKYDPRSSSTICAGSFSMLSFSAKTLKCPYCQSTFAAEINRKLCVTCGISQIGKATEGSPFLL